MGIASQVSLLVILIVGILSSPRIAGRGYFLLQRLGGWVFNIPAIIMAGVALYLTHAQFSAWQGNEISKYLLPPHAPIAYFARYAFSRFWMPYVISGAMAFLIFWAAWMLNKKFGERFFEQEELYFLALGIFLTGHPGWILYVLITLVTYALYLILTALYTKEMPRISFYYFWLPCAAITILASGYMTQFSWYANLLI